jgi:hypothetical protein
MSDSLSAELQRDPDELADALDLWGLRREKVLHLLDVRAARTARQLAQTCRVLAQSRYGASSGDAWDSSWELVRSDVAAMVALARPIVPEKEEEPSPTSLVGDSSGDCTLDAPTRSAGLSIAQYFEEEQLTRIGHSIWPPELPPAA